MSLARTNGLLLDDWGLTPLPVQDSRDMLEVVDDRVGTRPLIVAGQFPVEHWHATILS